MTLREKIAFLAIDAGDKRLLREWAADGTLPTIRLLLSRGLVGDITSVKGLYEGATWPCLYTGTNPARHGFHSLTQIRPGTYEFYRCTPRENTNREPFWNYLSRAGKKVAVLDIPLSEISEGLNGVQTVEWGSHDAIYGFQTWPRELKTHITQRFGSYPFRVSCNSIGRTPEAYSTFRDRMIEGVKKKTALTQHYLKQDEWDFFAQVFTEAHCVGHQCWHLHDPAHPNYDKDTVSFTGDPVREVYIAIDRALEKILAHIDNDTLIFFLTTHGMACAFSKDFMLGRILDKLDVIHRRQRGMLPKVAAWGWSRLPPSVRALLDPALYSIYYPVRLSSKMDLCTSRCFPYEDSSLVSGIRINLIGREPKGLVALGEEFDNLCRGLSNDLLDITDSASGLPIVKNVIKTADLFQGECLDHLPDLLVEWNDEVRVGSKPVSDDASCRIQVTSHKIGRVGGQYCHCRTGDHRPGGMFVALGSGIQPGTVARAVSIMDIAPTLLARLGVTFNDMDGRTIVEVVGDEETRN